MKKRIKLLFTIAAICFSLATLIFSVYASMSTTYGTNGMVNYIVEDVFVDIETRVYSTSKRYFGDNELKAQALGFESAGFETLNEMTDLDGTQTFNKVQLKNLDKGSDYTPLEADYVDTYSSETLTDPQPLNMSLEYSAKDYVFTYFVVIKLTNKSDHTLYSYIPVTIGDILYKAPGNSYVYRPTKTKEMETRNSSVYMVFAMSIKDINWALIDEVFRYPVAVTIDPTTVEDESALIKQAAHIAEKDVVSVTESKQTVHVTSNPATISTPITLFGSDFGFVMLSFDVSEVPSNSDVEFNVLMYADYGGNPIIPKEEEITSVEMVVGKYTSFEEIYANIESMIPIFGSVDRQGDGSYNVVIPQTYLDNGTMQFTFGVICPIELAETLEMLGLTELYLTITTNSKLTYEQNFKHVEWEEGNVAAMEMPFETTKNITVETVDLDGDIVTKAYTVQNYVLNKIPEDKTAINMVVTNQFAKYAYVFAGNTESFDTIQAILAMEMKSYLVVSSFDQGSALVNIPLSLDEDGTMEFYIVYLYDLEQITDGQEVTISATVEYSTPKSEPQTIFNLYLSYNYPVYEQHYEIEGIKDNTVTSIKIPSYYNGLPIKLIGHNAFANCTNLVTVDFEENSPLEEIEGYAFDNCTSLKTVNLHKCNNLKTIRYGIFRNCANLTTMSLPDSIIYIENDSLPTAGTWYNNNISNGKYTSSTGRVYALNCPTNATSYDFTGVHVVANGFAPSSLTTVTNLNSVEVICDSAFYGSQITTISLPATLKYVGEGIFRSCRNLTTITVNSANQKYSDGGANVIIDKTKQSIVAGCKNTNFANIPSYVTKIDEYAFHYAGEMGTVAIGGSISFIGEWAFEGCVINNLILGDNVEKLDWQAFGYSEVKNLTIGAKLKNSNSGIYCIGGVETITVSPSNPYYKVDGKCLIHISTKTLVKGTSNSTIPSYITTIGEDAFRGCTALTSIVIPEGVKVIESCAFEDCTALTSVKLPDSLTTIESNAFSYCSQLTTIEIPANVTVIEDWCFSNCKQLKTLIVKATNPPTLDAKFSVTFTAIYVPDASVNTYKSAAYWSEYAGIIKPLSEYVPPTE